MTRDYYMNPPKFSKGGDGAYFVSAQNAIGNFCWVNLLDKGEKTFSAVLFNPLWASQYVILWQVTVLWWMNEQMNGIIYWLPSDSWVFWSHEGGSITITIFVLSFITTEYLFADLNEPFLSLFWVPYHLIFPFLFLTHHFN